MEFHEFCSPTRTGEGASVSPVYTCLHANTVCVRVHACVRVRMRVCVVCVYVCVRVCVCVCVCVAASRDGYV